MHKKSNEEGFCWLRALLPTWRLFDQPAGEVRLVYRIKSQERESWSEWLSVFGPQKRNLLSLFINSEGTARLALFNLFERCLLEIENSREAFSFEGSVSYTLLKNAVEQKLREKEKGEKLFYQFSLLVQRQDVLEERFASPHHVLD